MSDILSDDDLYKVTKVPKGSPARITKQIHVLRDAGIYFWIRHDGSIGTTWYHVHNPRPAMAQNDEIPNFGAVR